ncbi:hypothetical protein ACIU1J_27450 [Azospirillum doebereinerae]|uniref:hypothetical protein n=1 Tax=Azospirillum doebereinerae TaxID=92933 RepID=UPI001EE55654|nr:hypothetical protein [Azospirillum doebereinerae]MCG5241356.1 hypothetical protein [Azospirillum doebereinerae]
MMAHILRQDFHTARKQHDCYRCGHQIRIGDRYLAVTFANGLRDGWAGVRYTKACRHCQPEYLCQCGECDFVVSALPADPIAPWLEPHP